MQVLRPSSCVLSPAPLALAAPVKDTSHPGGPFRATCVDGFIAVFGFSSRNWKANKPLTRWSPCLLASHFFPPLFFCLPWRRTLQSKFEVARFVSSPCDSIPFDSMRFDAIRCDSIRSDSMRFDFSYVLDNPAILFPAAIPYSTGWVPVPLVNVEHFWFLTYAHTSCVPHSNLCVVFELSTIKWPSGMQHFSHCARVLMDMHRHRHRHSASWLFNFVISYFG